MGSAHVLVFFAALVMVNVCAATAGDGDASSTDIVTSSVETSGHGLKAKHHGDARGPSDHHEPDNTRHPDYYNKDSYGSGSKYNDWDHETHKGSYKSHHHNKKYGYDKDETYDGHYYKQYGYADNDDDEHHYGRYGDHHKVSPDLNARNTWRPQRVDHPLLTDRARGSIGALQPTQKQQPGNASMPTQKGGPTPVKPGHA